MSTTLAALTFDCADAASLAAFWSAVLERPVDPDSTEGFASIGAIGQPAWYFIQVPEGASAKNRFHPDLVASGDLEAEVERVVALGAKRQATIEEGGHRWVTLTDPEGNVFDVAAG